MQEFVDRLDEVIAGSTDVAPPTLYRTITDPTVYKQFTGLKVGDTIRDDAYLSTSADSGVLLDFIQGEDHERVDFWINVPEGSKVLDVDAHTGPDDYKQKEFLLPRGTTLRVTNKTKGADGQTVLQVSVVPAAPTPSPAATPDMVVSDFPGPAPSPGARVYVHPQGARIYVNPDGSMEAYGANGKVKKTSATPEKLAAGHGAWTEIVPDASPATIVGVNPAVPVAPLHAVEPEVKSIKIAAPKKRIPMEFKETSVAQIDEYIEDSDYVFQQKVDGIRGQLVLTPGAKPWFRSKSGDRLVNPTATSIGDPLIKAMGAGLPEGAPEVTVDGELLNGKWYVFDMVIDGQDLPWEQRMAAAEGWVDSLRSQGLTQIVALPTARTPEQKRALFDAIRAGGGEGVMVKRRDAKYKFGQRTDQILKAKVTSTADVVVMETNAGGKEAAVVGVMRNGKLERVANVPTQGKFAMKPGDVIEVEYLWASPDTGLLTQARIKKPRPDKDPLLVTDSQFRFVDKKVLDASAMVSTPTAPTTRTIQTAGPEDLPGLTQEAVGDDQRSEYIRRAIEAASLFGDSAELLVSRNSDGSLAGALALIDRTDDPDAPGLIIDYVGARGGGAGSELVLRAAEIARGKNATLYAEPTVTSESYWSSIGFVEDPDDIASPLYGIPAGGLDTWIEARKGPVEASDGPVEAPSPATPGLSAGVGLKAYDEAVLKVDDLGLDNPADAKRLRSLARGKSITLNEAQREELGVLRREAYARIGERLGFTPEQIDEAIEAEEVHIASWIMIGPEAGTLANADDYRRMYAAVESLRSGKAPETPIERGMAMQRAYTQMVLRERGEETATLTRFVTGPQAEYLDAVIDSGGTPEVATNLIGSWATPAGVPSLKKWLGGNAHVVRVTVDVPADRVWLTLWADDRFRTPELQAKGEYIVDNTGGFVGAQIDSVSVPEAGGSDAHKTVAARAVAAAFPGLSTEEYRTASTLGRRQLTMLDAEGWPEDDPEAVAAGGLDRNLLRAQARLRSIVSPEDPAGLVAILRESGVDPSQVRRLLKAGGEYQSRLTGRSADEWAKEHGKPHQAYGWSTELVRNAQEEFHRVLAENPGLIDQLEAAAAAGSYHKPATPMYMAKLAIRIPPGGSVYELRSQYGSLRCHRVDSPTAGPLFYNDYGVLVTPPSGYELAEMTETDVTPESVPWTDHHGSLVEAFWGSKGVV